jgi:uncharacterized protein YdcH (DUF465 family)
MVKKTDSMEAKLGRLGARLDDLIKRAEKTRDYAGKINVEELMRQKASVERELKDLRLPARKAWRDLQSRMASAWGEVKSALVKAKGQFKK